MENITPHEFRTFAATERPRDKRDLKIGRVQLPVPIPHSFIQDFSKIPVYYQRQLPTCGGNAGTFVSNVVKSRIGSVRHLWINMRKIDDLPPDKGSYIRTIMKALKNVGVCELPLLPDNTQLSPSDYVDPTVLTPVMGENAVGGKVPAYAFHDGPFTMDAIKQLIYQNKVAILLVDCGDAWWKDKNGDVSWAASDVLPLKLGKYTGGHYVVVHSYNDKYIYFRNSWSSSWGLNGDGYFDESYLPHISEIAVPVSLPDRYIFKNYMWLGKKGEDVKQLQARLGVEQTGFFWFKTLGRVIDYQSDNNIPTTGFVGTLTLASLNS